MSAIDKPLSPAMKELIKMLAEFAVEDYLRELQEQPSLPQPEGGAS